MRVFISWSGERSKAAALALREWLPLVLQHVEPWMSATDIDAGQRWSQEVGQQLSETSFGILCLTRDNLLAPWLLFEAGALAKSLPEGAVVPYLIEGEISDITGPLSQFQAKKADQNSTLELLRTLNARSSNSFPADRLSTVFSMAWPKLVEQLARIPQGTTAAHPVRKEREILEELVQVVRTVERRTRTLEIEQPSLAASLLPDWPENPGTSFDTPLQEKKFYLWKPGQRQEKVLDLGKILDLGDRALGVLIAAGMTEKHAQAIVDSYKAIQKREVDP